MRVEHIAPMEIEAKSFEIITEECKERKIEIPEDVAFLVKRCIHTTADFEYAETMRFSELRSHCE